MGYKSSDMSQKRNFMADISVWFWIAIGGAAVVVGIAALVFRSAMKDSDDDY